MAENAQNPTTTAGAAGDAGAGGFVRPVLPSPAPSNISNNNNNNNNNNTNHNNSTSRSSSGLPHPRSHALRPGSAKEDKVRNFVEDRLMHMSRRYVKKYALKQPGDTFAGYASMTELCKDLEGLLDILWLSGTPSLQIPYLLNIANDFNTWFTSFPPAPVATFAALRKLDHCFSSLLSGQDIETKETLPGFENGLRHGMSRTDMVRCKSIVEMTRVLIVDVMTKEREPEDVAEEEDGPWTADDTDIEMANDAEDGEDDGEDDDDDDDEDMQMDVARVYENTLVQLGLTLGEGGGVGDIQVSDD
ncbi:hypothetical protein B0T22DRAFT_295426 [Podospora appendiculata]|uniref:Meiotic recombination protein DMC1 n=1 Tax=Podospora appendiculata TaxID=314037 RepID=A0AAE0X262_9PEZI|nr:hypothetical protein B0T22DRAFT_295426 [Podospora appendiculata]